MKRFLKLLLLLLWMGLIFMFSAQPQIQSEQTSNIAAEIIYKLYSFLPWPETKLMQARFMELYISPIRKLAHFTEFMILGILAYCNIKEYKKKNVSVYALVFCALYAVSDEIHQLFVLNRVCSVKDMAIDCLGALLGIVICHLFDERWKKDV